MEDKLGLGPIPGRTFIFVGVGEQDDQDYYWYHFTGTGDRGKVVPIFEQGLTGRVSNIRIIPKKYKNKWEYKVDVTVSADKEYVLRSGASTTFTKGLLSKLITLEDPGKLLCIAPMPGSSDKVVFCNVWDLESRKQIFFEGDFPDKIAPLVFDLQEKLGVDVQSVESLEKDKEEVETRYSDRQQYSGRSSEKDRPQNDDYAF